MKELSLILVLTFVSIPSLFAEDCSKEQAKESVEKMCKLIAEKGDAAKEDVKKYRYCGSNYVWVQDSDVKMVVHPIKGRLNGRDLKKNKDKKGKHLFVEFDKMAKSTAEGGWVEYFWVKPGDEESTPKVSFVKMCGAIRNGSQAQEFGSSN